MVDDTAQPYTHVMMILDVYCTACSEEPLPGRRRADSDRTRLKNVQKLDKSDSSVHNHSAGDSVRTAFALWMIECVK